MGRQIVALYQVRPAVHACGRCFPLSLWARVLEFWLESNARTIPGGIGNCRLLRRFFVRHRQKHLRQCPERKTKVRQAFLARTSLFHGCKIFHSSPGFFDTSAGSQKWTEKIWTDIGGFCEKNGERCRLQAPKLRVRFRLREANGVIQLTKLMRMQERNLQIHLHQTDARLLRAIEEALARIKNGTFGTCEACRNPISRARLEAVPWTHFCRDCKGRGHSL